MSKGYVRKLVSQFNSNIAEDECSHQSVGNNDKTGHVAKQTENDPEEGDAICDMAQIRSRAGESEGSNFRGERIEPRRSLTESIKVFSNKDHICFPSSCKNENDSITGSSISDSTNATSPTDNENGHIYENWYTLQCLDKGVMNDRDSGFAKNVQEYDDRTSWDAEQTLAESEDSNVYETYWVLADSVNDKVKDRDSILGAGIEECDERTSQSAERVSPDIRKTKMYENCSFLGGVDRVGVVDRDSGISQNTEVFEDDWSDISYDDLLDGIVFDDDEHGYTASEKMLLDSETESDKKLERKKTAEELLKTEEIYVEQLNFLVKLLKCLHKTPHKMLFKRIGTKVETILKFHQDFILPQLNDRMSTWESNPQIGDIMKNNAPFFSLYTEYVKDLGDATDAVGKLEDQPASYKAIMEKVKKIPGYDGLSLKDQLAVPMERLTGYKLLLQSYTEYLSETSEKDQDNVKDAIALISKAQKHPNEAAMKKETFYKMVHLYQNLRGITEESISPSRELIREGLVTCPASEEAESRYLYLFNDILLMCQKPIMGTYWVLAQIDMEDMKVSRAGNSISSDIIMVSGGNASLYFMDEPDMPRRETDFISRRHQGSGYVGWFQTLKGVKQQFMKTRRTSSDIGQSPETTKSNFSVCRRSTESSSRGAEHSDDVASKETDKIKVEVTETESTKPTDKSYNVMKELLSTERTYVDKLCFLNACINLIKTENIVPDKMAAQMFPNVDAIYQFHVEFFLPQIEARVRNWDSDPRIGDVILKNAPFLKLYNGYTQCFDKTQVLLRNWKEKSEKLAKFINEVRFAPDSSGLSLLDHMLEPIQRLPRYELLLKEYMKHLPRESADYSNTEGALQLVAEITGHSNEAFKKVDNFKKVLEVHRSLRMSESISPGRELIKDGYVTYITPGTCLKQRRYLYLFTDVLLVCAESRIGSCKFRLRTQLNIDRIEMRASDNVIVPDSFIVMGKQKTIELIDEIDENGEKTKWFETIKQAVDNFRDSRKSVSSLDMEDNVFEQNDDGRGLPQIPDSSLGTRAPRWIPNEIASACMACQTHFSAMLRRHHCRACGWVVCHKCSSQKAPLQYLKNKMLRVCSKCYRIICHLAV